LGRAIKCGYLALRCFARGGCHFIDEMISVYCSMFQRAARESGSTSITSKHLTGRDSRLSTYK